MTRIPDQQEHRRRFAALSVSERRQIVKAVNRGRTVGRRKDAPLAVGVARQQQRFWRFAWLVGPLIGLFGLRESVAVALANAFMGTMIMALIAMFYIMRARKAEALNREVATGRRRPGDNDAPVKDAGKAPGKDRKATGKDRKATGKGTGKQAGKRKRD